MRGPVSCISICKNMTSTAILWIRGSLPKYNDILKQKKEKIKSEMK